jgi:PadR family transcriptional regulator PadR
MTADPLPQLRRGTIEFCILALVRDEPRYGFDLTRALSAAGGLVTSDGTVHPLLARLRREGLLESSWVESTEGPPRRYHSITPEGRAALDGFVVQWRHFRNAVDGILSASDR